MMKYKTHGSNRNNDFFRLTVNSKKMRDGLHGHTCCQIEWVKIVMESFEKDDTRIKFISRYITSFFPIEFLISYSTNGPSKIGIEYDFLSVSEGNCIFNSLMARFTRVGYEICSKTLY